MFSLVVTLILLVPEVPPQCAAPPQRDMAPLTQFAQASGSLSVGLDSIATWCFDSSGAWTGGSKKANPQAAAVGDCKKAIASCEAAKSAVTGDSKQLMYDTLAEIDRPFLGVKYKPKRSGLAERPQEATDCLARERATLFAQAQARMDLARLASVTQNEYANYRTWLFSEGLKCAQAVARGETDLTRRGIAMDAQVQGGGTQQVPGQNGNGGADAGVAVAEGGARRVVVGGSAGGASATNGTNGSGSGGSATNGSGTAGTNGVNGSGGSGSGGSATSGSGTAGANGVNGSGGSGSGGSATNGSGAAGASGVNGSGGSGSGGSATNGSGTAGASGVNGSGGSGSGGSATNGSGAAGANGVAGTNATIGSATVIASAGAGGTRTTPFLGGPTAEREKALGSSMLEKWRYFLTEQQKLEGDVDWTGGFLASRELRDCRCVRPVPGEVVRRIEKNEKDPQLQADDDKNTRCELCLLDAYPKWKVRAQKQCALALELTEFEINVLQRSDDGNGLPPRCIDAAKDKLARASGRTGKVTLGGDGSVKPSGGGSFIIMKTEPVAAPAPQPVEQPKAPVATVAPMPPREDGRIYVRVFTSHTCVAEVTPGPIEAHNGDVLPIPTSAKEITVRGSCGGIAELYFGKEEKPRVSESFARNQPLRLQFRQ